jgi:hypothetical protein
MSFNPLSLAYRFGVSCKIDLNIRLLLTRVVISTVSLTLLFPSEMLIVLAKEPKNNMRLTWAVGLFKLFVVLFRLARAVRPLGASTPLHKASVNDIP